MNYLKVYNVIIQLIKASARYREIYAQTLLKIKFQFSINQEKISWSR